jgi:hypothetical protein
MMSNGSCQCSEWTLVSAGNRPNVPPLPFTAPAGLWLLSPPPRKPVLSFGPRRGGS